MRSKSVIVFCLVVLCLSVLGATRQQNAPDASGERTPVPREDQPHAGYELAVAAQAPIEIAAARSIAEVFVHEQAASGDWPDWAGATLGEAVPFYSTAASHPLAYEFPVIKDGVAHGAVLCGGTEGTTAVISYRPEGRPIAVALREAVEEAIGGPVAGNARYLYGGVRQFGIEARPSEAANLPLGNDALTVIPEEGSILYSFTFVPASRLDWENRFKANFRVSREWIEQQREVRHELLSKRDGRKLEVTASKAPQVTRGSLSSSKFANFEQQKRKWSNGTCYTGCSPVAEAIVFEFWDRSGFPSMIGSDSKNKSHSSAGDADVLTALTTLRKELGTFCSGNQGSTWTFNLDDGAEAYARGRGYKKSTADNNLTGKWSTIINEIDAGRPLLLAFNGDFDGDGHTDGHTAVPYKYTDSTKNSDDQVCVRTGWNDPTECYMVNSSTETWDRVTVIKPKK